MKSPPDVDNFLQHVFSAAEQEQIASYASRGRRLRETSSVELNDMFKTAMRSWAAPPSDKQAKAVFEEAQSEYALRGLEPPYGEVKDAVDTLAKASSALLASADAREAVSGEMLDLYLKSTKSEN